MSNFLKYVNGIFSPFKRIFQPLQMHYLRFTSDRAQNSVCPNATLASPKWLRLGIAQTSLALLSPQRHFATLPH